MIEGSETVLDLVHWKARFMSIGMGELV